MKIELEQCVEKVERNTMILYGEEIL